jgi:hypothetical protein
VTATAIAAGQGDLSDRDFIRDLQERIEETQRALDLALKDMRPSLDRSLPRMRELLQRPTADYEAAARAETHKYHLGAAALSLSSSSTMTLVQDTQARNTKSPDRATNTMQTTAEQIPLAASKKRGRVTSSTSTDFADPPKAKRRKTAATPGKEKRKP